MRSFKSQPVIALMMSIPALIAPVGPSHAKQICEKKCFRAETCPIVGDKCLRFDWCRDECHEAGSNAPGQGGTAPDGAKPPSPPLPEPNLKI